MSKLDEKLTRAKLWRERATNDPNAQLKLIKGSQFDRMFGLEVMETMVPGRTIIDVGSHRGIIDYELSKWGPKAIHGFDIYQRGIETSQEIFTDVLVPSAFRVCDLSKGIDLFRQEFADILLPEYDIVMMLAVFQHIKQQMSGPELKKLMLYFTAICREYFVLRSPNFGQIDGFILEQGFELVYYHNLGKELSPVAIYERRK